MNASLRMLQPDNHGQFRVDYPYFGLFGTADVKMLDKTPDQLFECRLRNGQTVTLKKIGRKWVDFILDQTTPLSAVLGTSIDDYLKQ
jgi:ribosome assembly protein YihI (activator of Der GTPase)